MNELLLMYILIYHFLAQVANTNHKKNQSVKSISSVTKCVQSNQKVEKSQLEEVSDSIITLNSLCPQIHDIFSLSNAQKLH